MDDADLSLLFLNARTHRQWIDRPVEVSLLRRLYELARCPPTSANCEPMRLVFVKSHAAKERLRPALSEGNVAQTLAAPATAIVVYDTRFFEYMPRLAPHRPELGERMSAQPEAARDRTAFQNGSLQGGT